MYIFCIFFLLFFVQSESLADGDANNWSRVRAVASVKQYPTAVHKCIAAFISSDVLITTARCLYCDNDCDYFVYAFEVHLMPYKYEPKGVMVNVTKTVIHPGFETDVENYDIGLIKLASKLSQASVLKMPSTIYGKSGLKVVAFRWTFKSDYREYYLNMTEEKLISRELCSFAFKTYISVDNICTRRKEPLIMGAFSEGSPLISHEKGDHNLLGFLTREFTNKKTYFGVYQAIFKYTHWTSAVMDCNFTCNPELNHDNHTVDDLNNDSTTPEPPYTSFPPSAKTSLSTSSNHVVSLSPRTGIPKNLTISPLKIHEENTTEVSETETDWYVTTTWYGNQSQNPNIVKKNMRASNKATALKDESHGADMTKTKRSKEAEDLRSPAEKRKNLRQRGIHNLYDYAS